MQSVRPRTKLHGLDLSTSHRWFNDVDHASWWGRVGDTSCSTPTFAKEGFNWAGEVPPDKETVRSTTPYATEPEAEHPPKASPGAASPRTARSASPRAVPARSGRADSARAASPCSNA